MTVTRRAALVLLCVAATLASSSPASAAHRRVVMDDYVQDVWESQEGALPHPGVTTVRQPRDGYLWVGTYAGVRRFDGAEFQSPVSERVPGLRDHVKCILDARDGALWVGTRREGALRIKDGVVTALTAKDGLAEDIRAMAQTNDGVIWFATGVGLLAREPDGRIHTYTTKDGLPDDAIWVLDVDANDDLWIGTGSFGLVRRHAGAFHVVPLPSAVAAGGGFMANPLALRVTALARDGDGVLWAGTTVGLARISEDHRESSFEHRGTQINVIVPTRRGELWLGTNTGLIRRQGESVRTYTAANGLVHDSVLSAFEDAEGGIWIGTRVGLARLRLRVARTYTARDGLGDDIVMCVLQTPDGDIWAGHRNGLSRLRGDRWTTLGVKDGLPHAGVRALAAGPDGALWIGTFDGLAVHRNGRITTYPTVRPYAIRALAVDDAGRVFTGTATGFVDVIENGSLRSVLTKESSPCRANSFTSILAAADHTVWMATGNGGLVRWREGKSECIRDGQVLARNDIRSLDRGADGALWISSIGGLARLANGIREDFSGTTGPFDSAAYAALEDGRGALWSSTPKGLFQISLKTLGDYADPQRAPFAYRMFGTGDGMESSVGGGDGQPTAIRSTDGRLWFTTVAGLTVVDPSRIESREAAPPVFVDGLSADRQAVDLLGAHRLPAGTRNVELRFRALNFVTPERIVCRYKLEGFDASWVDSGARRAAYYTNLPPRRYRFRVIAASPSGVWNETGATLDFEMQPYFYQTRWFLPLCALLLVGTATGAYRVRMAGVRANELELKRRVEEALAQVKTLSGLLPICASCKKIRDDSGYWSQMETYIHEHSGAGFSHSICPDCMVKLYPDYAASQKK